VEWKWSEVTTLCLSSINYKEVQEWKEKSLNHHLGIMLISNKL